MFKIEITDEDGRQLQVSKRNFLYFKKADGTERYWEWEHIRGVPKISNSSSVRQKIFWIMPKNCCRIKPCHACAEVPER